ncbi:hypothetical protein ASG17_11385 [Brevundimonas sp. Leaf363]|uniref:hypothetical protein n=1 Tax=Brevundimonas sp. Leaf363 TaxID=1736353 RepID=UPI000701A1F7|nr:hypothetical protein [Brevundimonas sp. Leaf363]KQS54246.1 hypothetical protein ASG17_11385 [Brevundimonas sp. Leaf363]
MPDYIFEIWRRGVPTPDLEPAAAADDVQARSLAELRLLMGPAFVAVTVRRMGMEAFTLGREGAVASPPVVAIGRQGVSSTDAAASL